MTGGPIRVLLVEDNPADARLVREALASAPGFHFEVEHAGDLDVALAALASRPFEAVLLDLGLPGSDGLETLQRVHGISTELPIVVFTGLDDEETGLRAVQFGAQGYLVKGEVDPRVLSRSLRHAIERHRMVAELEMARRREHHMATHDALTGLPNRQLMFDLLAQNMAYCSRYGLWAAVLFIDLDGFKRINDRLGHDAGDRVLQTVAERLKSAIRTSDTAARLGGDEFIVLLSNMQRTQDAFIVARAILQELSRPYRLRDEDVTLFPSIGIAIYPGDGTKPEALVRSADAAMYSAKRHGGATYEFFSAALALTPPERQIEAGALRRALQQGELCLYYQPQVEAATGRVLGAEALLRWHHAELGVLSPRAFLELAEAEGVARQVASFTLRCACEQLRDWRRGGYPDVRLAVNLALGDLREGSLTRAVEEALAGSGVPPERLELELPPLASSADAAGLPSLAALRDMGLRISLDGYGRTPAWRETLEAVPADAVKVNGSLVRGLGRDERDTEAVAAILAAASAAGMETVGSGVETQRQLDELRSQRCGRVQGYYYSQALPPAEFGRMLRDGVLPDVDPPS